MILSKNSSQSGTSLLEATIAACTSALFLGSLFTMNISAMRTMRTAREAANASQVLQQRVEAMRIANWHQITNADWVKNNLLNTNAAGGDTLKNIRETLTLIPYGSTAASTQIVRSNGSAQIVAHNSSLLTEQALKVVWTVAYNGGTQGQSNTRQTVAILAKGGVAKW